MVYGEVMSEDVMESIPGLLDPDPRVLSVNQLVSYNLMRARRAHAWSQQDVAELLEKYTGRSWSNASVSAAERAWQGGRSRRFDACEIVAMAKIFDEPVTFFFLPPDRSEYPAKWVGLKEFKGGRPDMDDTNDQMALVPTSTFVDSLSLDEAAPTFTARMQELCRDWLSVAWSPPEGQFLLSRAQPPTAADDVDWAEVEETAEEIRSKRADEAERALSSAHRDAFLRKNADEMAMLIAERLHQMGMIRESPSDQWGRPDQADEDPPF